MNETKNEGTAHDEFDMAPLLKTDKLEDRAVALGLKIEPCSD